MKMILPFPPSSNRYWRNYRGHMVKSDEARTYQQEAKILARVAGVFPVETALVKVKLAFFRPAKRGDLDNRIKILLDALQGIAYEDDSQVKEIHAVMNDDKRNPRVEVSVCKLPLTILPLATCTK